MVAYVCVHLVVVPLDFVLVFCFFFFSVSLLIIASSVSLWFSPLCHYLSPSSSSCSSLFLCFLLLWLVGCDCVGDWLVVIALAAVVALQPFQKNIPLFASLRHLKKMRIDLQQNCSLLMFHKHNSGSKELNEKHPLERLARLASPCFQKKT